jgi:hypothetical protein
MATLFQVQSDFEPPREEEEDDESTESCDNRRRRAPVWFVTRCLEEYKV